MGRADILMITYRSAGYVHLSLPRLLDTLGPDDRVWLWHNGEDEATIEAIRPYREDDRVARFHHSRDNVRLREPTNWLWQNSRARFVSKVDDDCLVSHGWLDTFASAHDANPEFGVIGSWRHLDEEFRPELAQRKIQEFRGGHSLMRNLWVQGSGYLMPRALAEAHGSLGPEESFTGFCIRLARAGAVNGFYYPFLPEDHMDDPRSPHTLIMTTRPAGADASLGEGQRSHHGRAVDCPIAAERRGPPDGLAGPPHVHGVAAAGQGSPPPRPALVGLPATW